MLMIRFQRVGRKNDPSFRIAVLPKTAGPKAGKYVDLVGTYNPRTKEATVKADSIKEWIAKGAQVSPTVMNLLINKGVLTGKKVNVLPLKTPIKKEVPAEEAAPAPKAEVAEEAPVEAAPAETVEEAPAPEVVEEVAAEPVAEEAKEEEAVAA
ncbi:MAG: 30S ribosomal protein S16 [Candidatus Pacebacteria bacterium]|nr:30S ribosomal protein S16 [Candidatus Paceibacterota bacterium]